MKSEDRNRNGSRSKMGCASLQQRGGSLKHLPKHPHEQKSSRFSGSDIARAIREPYKGSWAFCQGRIKIRCREVAQGSRTLRMALLFYGNLYSHTFICSNGNPSRCLLFSPLKRSFTLFGTSPLSPSCWDCIFVGRLEA